MGDFICVYGEEVGGQCTTWWDNHILTNAAGCILLRCTKYTSKVQSQYMHLFEISGGVFESITEDMSGYKQFK